MLNGERRNFICPEAIALTFPRLNKCTPEIKREHGVPFGVLVLIVQICTACSQVTRNRAGSRGEHAALPRRMRRSPLPVVLFCDRRNHGLCPIGKKSPAPTCVTAVFTASWSTAPTIAARQGRPR